MWYQSDSLNKKIAELKRENRYPSTGDNTADCLELIELQLKENGFPPYGRTVRENGLHHNLSTHNPDVYGLPMDFEKGVLKRIYNGRDFYAKFHKQDGKTVINF